MPRGPRPVAPGFPHHVIHRGNNRQTIFFERKDYERFMMILAEVKRLHPSSRTHNPRRAREIHEGSGGLV